MMLVILHDLGIGMASGAIVRRAFGILPTDGGSIGRHRQRGVNDRAYI